MEVLKLDNAIPINDYSIVRIKEMGNITEIMYSEKRSNGGYIKKLDKDHYCDLRTGELKEFKHIENRSQDLSNVAKSLAKGRDLLNANITDVDYCRWATFTYAENMTDPKRLMRDFQICVKNLRKLYGQFEYITAAEPQGRGAWHLHVVFIFNNKAPFMSNEAVSKCWKQGFVTIRRLDNVDNVGAYLTAYLGDMELSECQKNDIDIQYIKGIKSIEFINENGEVVTKKYIKGARLSMYPAGFHIFRYSKGIKKPIVSVSSYKKAKEKVCSDKQTFSKTVLLNDPTSDFSNTLTYEYYNNIRK